MINNEDFDTIGQLERWYESNVTTNRVRVISIETIPHPIQRDYYRIWYEGEA